jgi:hypothetical protein
VIEDIEGATMEPSRSRHVLALSAAVASLAFVLLVALVAPQVPGGFAPEASSSPASPRGLSVPASVSNPLAQLRVDLTQASQCGDGAQLTPPYLLAVDMASGRVFAMTSEGRSGRPIPVMLVPASRAGWLTVTCATPDLLAP